MWGGNPQRTNSLPTAAALLPPLQVRWRFPAQSWSASSPVVANGLVYFGSSDGRLYAVDALNGQLRWNFDTGGPVLSTVAVADSTVFVGSADHSLYALDAQSGALRWRHETGSWIVSSPLPAHGLVLVGSADGYLYAVDATTGSLVWSFETDGWVVSSPATDGQAVVVGSWGGTVYALDLLSGEQQWRFEVGQPVVATPLISDGKVFVSSLGNTSSIPFPSLVVTGIELLSKLGIFDVGQVIGSYIDRSYISTATRDPSAGGKLYALNLASGQEIWNASLEGWIVGSPSLFVPAEGSAPTAALPPTAPGVGATLEEQARYIESLLGCLVCRPTVPLSEAQGQFVEALRQIIRQKLSEAESQESILQYFVQSYGPLILYSPPPTLHHRSVVLATMAGYKYAFHVDTGETLLQMTLGNLGPISSSPLLSGPTMYVINAYGQGQIYDLLSATPGGVGSFRTTAGSFSSPALVDGMLYVVSEDGQLTAYGTPTYRLEMTESPGPVYPGGTTMVTIKLIPLVGEFDETVSLTTEVRTLGRFSDSDVTIHLNRSEIAPDEEVVVQIALVPNTNPSYSQASFLIMVNGVSESGAEAGIGVEVRAFSASPTPTPPPSGSSG